MMRSLFSGVSGLQAHQTRMDVIGNNIANVNTIGFKSSRVTFQEIFNETLRGSSAPDDSTGRGGSNPMQIGLGMSIGSIDNIMTRGSVERTDNPTDLSIDGDGFFVVKATNGDAPQFTRAGNFTIDKQGNLVTSSGMIVQGWQSYAYDSTTGNYNFDTEKPLTGLNLYSDPINGNKQIIAASATTNMKLSGNLNALAQLDTNSTTTGNQPETFNVPSTVYDSMGNAYNINITFSKNPTAYASNNLQWDWAISSPITSVSNGVTQTLATAVGSGTITFDSTGKIASSAIATALTITPNTTATLGPVTGAAAFSPKLDISELTQFSGDTTVAASDVNGYPTGNLTSFNVGSDGVITGMYSNGKQKPLGMIALAYFENPAGLKKDGANLFSQTTNSGEFKKGSKPGSAGVGALSPGTLEMSNVDLSKEFTTMIVTQRGFQANSKIITTSDEMLQDLVNLKR